MALKYWYVAGNGSSNWNVNSVWYNGPGGTGGVAGVPTTADDAVVNAASGSGTLTISGTSTCNSLNTKTFTGTFAGTQALNIVTSSVANNNSTVLQLGGNHTFSGTITFTATVAGTNGYLQIDCNGIFHKGGMTFNSVGRSWFGINDIDWSPIRLTGILTLTAGRILSTELYTGIITTSNSNVRTFSFDNVYLSGTGTLLTVTTQTNLTWNISEGTYLTSNVSTNNTLTFSGIVYSPNIYIQGSGTAATNITSTSTIGIFPNIFISKIGGSLQFGSSSILDLTFIEGTTITWSSTSAQLTVYGSITLCNSLTVVSTNSLFFAGGAIGNIYQTLTTFNKVFTSWLQVNDNNSCSTILEVYGDYISTSTSTNPQSINIVSWSEVKFYGAVQLVTGININATGRPVENTYVEFNTITSATTLTTTLAYVVLGNTTLSGNIQHNSNTLYIKPNSTINIFAYSSSSTVNYRELYLNNAIINLNANTGNAWNIAGILQGVTYFDSGTSTINIIDSTAASLTFAGGGGRYYNLNINRSTNISGITVYTILTGIDNYFVNFRDLTILPNGVSEHYIVFPSGNYTYFWDTFQVGNSINVTRILPSSTGVYILYKLNKGLLIFPNVYIQNASAFSTAIAAWYAVSGSADVGGNSGWIFNTPPRRLGSLGVG